MKIKIFGILTEVVNSELEVHQDITTLDELKTYLLLHYPNLNNFTYKIVVNHVVPNSNCILNPGDEIALLPPFTGG